MLDENDTGFEDTNGDLVNDATYGHSPLDTDNDGLMDAFDLDSDGDLCYDVTEAGYQTLMEMVSWEMIYHTPMHLTVR